MIRILVLFAHPALEKSRVHARLLHHIQKVKNITIHDLYEEYPDFDIDVKREQQLLQNHDLIILQHPFYWYSAPALVKQWLDLVFEHGWAYGTHGVALKDKYIFNVISSGGSRQSYSVEGFNRITIRQFLAPFEQTARLCRMIYLPPYIVSGTHKLTAQQMDDYGKEYASLIQQFQHQKLPITELESTDSLNEFIASLQTANS